MEHLKKPDPKTFLTAAALIVRPRIQDAIPDLEEALRHNPHLILTRHEDILILADRRGDTLAHLTLEGRVLRLSPSSDWLQDYPAWEAWVDAEPPQAQLMEDYWYRAADPEDF